MRALARLGATLILLGAIAWLVAPQDIAQELRRIAPGWLALAILALWGQILLSALRWQVTTRALGGRVGRGRAVREYGLSVAANTFLPGGVTGDLARVLRARHMGWRLAAASVVIERLAGQVALGLVALASAVVWLGPLKGLALGVAVVAGAALAAQLLPGPRRTLRRAWTAEGVAPAQITLTLAILMLNLGGIWACARAVGLALSVEATLALLPLTLLAMLLPLTINGWGLREGVAAALWPLWGVAAAQAVAASVAFGLACMGAALLGLLPLALSRAATPRPDPG